MPSLFDRILSAVGGLVTLRADVTALQAQMEGVMTRQEQADAALQTLKDGYAGIAADIEDLKSKITVGDPVSQETVDALTAVADKFKALDAAYPQAPSEG